MLLAIIQIFSYFALMTLAGYVLNRGRFHPLSLTIALALVSYALMMADLYLDRAFPGEFMWLGRVLWIAYPIPVVAWARVAILLKPGMGLDVRLDRFWWTLLLPVTMLLILGGWIGDDLVIFENREPGPLYWTFGVYNVIVTAATLWLLHRNYAVSSPRDSIRRAFWWMRLAGFTYTGGMIVLMSGIISPRVAFTLFVVDVAVFGLGAITYDALSEGQAVRYDLGFTFIKIVLVMGVIVAPWGAALLVADVWSIEFALAMFVSLAAVATGITLLEDIEGLLDRMLFSRGRRETRDALRTLMLNAARQPDSMRPITALDHDEFIRLTRRALSYMPNLPRLAGSPLAGMQIVSERLEDDANALERARELRQILAECIDSLRPEDRVAGTTDEWRFFNALYYPYVAGISPYKRNLFTEALDDDTTAVVRWFQTTVPPRTLYNWQNRGAEMIAGILLEREQQLN